MLAGTGEQASMKVELLTWLIPSIHGFGFLQVVLPIPSGRGRKANFK